MALSRDQKIAKARELRAAGWTYKEIASRLGCSIGNAATLADPEIEKRKRAYDRKYKRENRKRINARDRAYNRSRRGTCTSCEGRMGIGHAEDGVCIDCRKDARHLRCIRIERLWSEGITGPELAAEFGWTKSRVGVEMAHMRAEGYDLPYRYNHHANSPRFPEQVAA